MTASKNTQPLIQVGYFWVDEESKVQDPNSITTAKTAIKRFVNGETSYEDAENILSTTIGSIVPIEKMNEVIQIYNGFDDEDEPPGISPMTNKLFRPWTSQEDFRLLAAIHKHGIGNWKAIADLVGFKRSRAQCSQRWNRALNPAIKKENWTSDEDDLLLNLVLVYGPHMWATVAKDMNGRSDVQCRYRYYQLKKEKKKYKNKGNQKGKMKDHLNKTHSGINENHQNQQQNIQSKIQNNPSQNILNNHQPNILQGSILPTNFNIQSLNNPNNAPNIQNVPNLANFQYVSEISNIPIIPNLMNTNEISNIQRIPSIPNISLIPIVSPPIQQSEISGNSDYHNFHTNQNGSQIKNSNQRQININQINSSQIPNLVIQQPQQFPEMSNNGQFGQSMVIYPSKVIQSHQIQPSILQNVAVAPSQILVQQPTVIQLASPTVMISPQNSTLNPSPIIQHQNNQQNVNQQNVNQVIHAKIPSNVTFLPHHQILPFQSFQQPIVPNMNGMKKNVAPQNVNERNVIFPLLQFP
ncbi:hypothetical protein TRFO_25756 [Tritrichomonas foetus]|uniref:Myb-like DNA-binding domain containing protein n=1 Tax=Tritrichomonas foetus TaxID=1144522 RepID=A0A1J4K963_9EUKA|nr:hypothetical protein TRFO_25756 [Tritrichomonas foetus]|eukprot:OHT06214.1 hypothetical protein TRFO_25756 [Tritrichomonas foetus]